MLKLWGASGNAAQLRPGHRPVSVDLHVVDGDILGPGLAAGIAHRFFSLPGLPVIPAMP